ncbi:hypothetical protein COCCADRAFT_28221 [Bipolaris zeicola 26-R-13]|uniref:Uncharacterized protein n=1 Tax=Cochliobolus carbonum (strain 26-R-13) TaxID=930089 RepID=W6Y6V0_COCC2|nr:uncharacterized protein COCCADRAFT_28221 [Bipolaris zeicola 26-R-13]EUC30989.1 hypothetical protein COCCADRAFT_28221 [Bipolaris zeicola 26-R-13]
MAAKHCNLRAARSALHTLNGPWLLAANRQRRWQPSRPPRPSDFACIGSAAASSANRRRPLTLLLHQPCPTPTRAMTTGRVQLSAPLPNRDASCAVCTIRNSRLPLKQRGNNLAQQALRGDTADRSTSTPHVRNRSGCCETSSRSPIGSGHLRDAPWWLILPRVSIFHAVSPCPVPVVSRQWRDSSAVWHLAIMSTPMPTSYPTLLYYICLYVLCSMRDIQVLTEIPHDG